MMGKRLAWVCIFVVALAVRVGVTARFQGLTAPINHAAFPDQEEYELLAYQVSIGQGYYLPNGVPTASRPPGTTFILAPVYVLFGRSNLMGRLWWCVLSAGTCVAAAWVAGRCIGRRAALLAGFGLAFYPGHFYYAMHYMSEVPFNLWLLLACGWSIQALREDKRRCDVLAGLSWGFAALTRPQILLVLPIAGLVLLVLRLRRRAVLGHVAAQALVLVVTLAPWVARNALVVGRASVCTLNGGYAFWAANNDVVFHDPSRRGIYVNFSEILDDAHPLTGSEKEREAAAWRYGLAFVREHGRQMPLFCLTKLYRLLTPFEATDNRAVYWSFALSWIVAAPLVVLGLWRSLRYEPTAGLVLLAPILATLGTAVIFYGSIRFRDSIAAILVLLAAAGADALLSRVREGLWR